MAQRDETNGRMLVQTLFNPHDPHPISADAAGHYRLPRDQTVIMGSRIEL